MSGPPKRKCQSSGFFRILSHGPTPGNTKNEAGKRDPEMHQTKKGNQWYFGMKAHIGVDSKAKIVHSVAATAANVHDSRTIADILHGDETRVWGNNAYQGQREAILQAAPHTQDFTHHRGNRASALSDEEVAKNRTKSRVRAYVEHPFRILKCVFGFRKVCCRGIAKNLNRLQVSFALVNLFEAPHIDAKLSQHGNADPKL